MVEGAYAVAYSALLAYADIIYYLDVPDGAIDEVDAALVSLERSRNIIEGGVPGEVPDGDDVR